MFRKKRIRQKHAAQCIFAVISYGCFEITCHYHSMAALKFLNYNSQEIFDDEQIQRQTFWLQISICWASAVFRTQQNCPILSMKKKNKERNDCFAVITLLQNHRTRRPAHSYLHCSFYARNSLKYNFLVLGGFIKHFHRANCLVYPFYQTKGINVFFFLQCDRHRFTFLVILKQRNQFFRSVEQHFLCFIVFWTSESNYTVQSEKELKFSMELH